MYRDQNYKIVVYHGKDEGELYNLEEDPYEFNNLWNNSAYLKVKDAMMGKLLDWLVSQELNLGSRGGESFPEASQRLNNKLK